MADADNEKDKQIRSLLGWMQTLGGSVRIADENGLFIGKGNEREAIFSKLIEAGVALEKKDGQVAQVSLTAADGLFNQSWHGATTWWRLCYAYGLVHLAASVLSGSGAGLLVLWTSQMFEQIVPMQVCIFGVCGAMLRSLFYLSWQANRRNLRAVWITRSFSGPFIALFLAVGL